MCPHSSWTRLPTPWRLNELSPPLPLNPSQLAVGALDQGRGEGPRKEPDSYCDSDVFGAPGAERVGPSVEHGGRPKGGSIHLQDPGLSPRNEIGAGAERPLVARVYFLALLLARPPFIGNGFKTIRYLGKSRKHNRISSSQSRSSLPFISTK